MVAQHLVVQLLNIRQLKLKQEQTEVLELAPIQPAPEIITTALVAVVADGMAAERQLPFQIVMLSIGIITVAALDMYIVVVRLVTTPADVCLVQNII